LDRIERGEVALDRHSEIVALADDTPGWAGFMTGVTGCAPARHTRHIIYFRNPVAR
jgi:hypothetical protein